MNKGHNYQNNPCTDQLLVDLVKTKKGMFPNIDSLSVRLKAVRVAIDDEFPDLPSPVSVRSFSSVNSGDLAIPFSDVVKGT